MPRRLKPLPTLHDEQRLAVDPEVHAAVSASAGTGKTQVLTARVLRLLLGGVRPEAILCLTFTKAGAAEMANRIGERLARWVRMKDDDLGLDLRALGADIGPSTRDDARRLFARVLEAPGGLRIQTIHAFAQTLLAAFPAEAGITPGFQPIEGRAEQQLARRTLATLIADAEVGGDTGLIADIQALSMRLGEQGAEQYLLTCAHRGAALAALGHPATIEPALRDLVGLEAGDIDALIADLCHDDRFDCELLRTIGRANLDWGTTTGMAHAAAVEEWLALDPHGRVAALDRLASVFFTGTGNPRVVSAGQRKAHCDYDRDCAALADAIAQIVAMRSAAALVAIQAAGLRAGQAYAIAYAAAKRAAGVADFDDLIHWTRALLEQPGIGAWVRFKLDRRTDHILVDEAQDTNADQWAIVDALTDEFFSGSSEAERRWRTLFMVGDYKQAIFRFQGTDPAEYERMRGRVEAKADDLRQAALADPEVIPRDFRDVAISSSFRSSPAILQLVDSAIAVTGHEALGLKAPPPLHRVFHGARPGRVEWWPATDVEAERGEAEGEEGWLDEADRAHASRISKWVRARIDEKPVLATTGRQLSPGDILILVRSRGELASLIVARLFAEKVKVAGIDRLHLQRPLAVKDLLAAITFAVQPLDNLNLASLLVSPLIGWDQDSLYRLAYDRNGDLWPVLQDRAASDADGAAALDLLRPLLAMADYAVPSRFLETILSGPMQGRRRLIERLGPEARDPIEELVSSALEFERAETASLERFLAWFASGDVEIKRDPSASADAVRVMTVHGAKGLEAPLVILADATADPAKLGPTSPPLDFPVRGHEVPLIRPRKAERRDPFTALIERDEQLDRAEHLRLLYVALTRAQEHLVVTGIRKKSVAELSWHEIVRQALERLDAVEEDGGLVHAVSGDVPRKRERTAVAIDPALPDWLRRPAPPEARPPRPLAPSALAEDDQPFPPPPPGGSAAARRGTLLHRLFERLPEVAPDRRRAAALAWLKHSAGVSDAAAREEIAGLACAIIADPVHAELFGPGSLAEAPIAATLPDGRVIAGAVDRLLVDSTRVRLIDFKTGTNVPSGPDSLPRAHRLQMEAYRDALAVIFPDRTIDAALLYTAGPKILAVPG
ncbi:double-strand break repair helicase AddA [Sphingomonas mesophila]|uniref:double-strand break repair helicase AddA n=1 Tax=Sphingomonas mesophila TaxID=2303576 RepID=UPI000E57F0E0|nr:double-strand break repair helicase AddA [Sphingomonas mesophila]